MAGVEYMLHLIWEELKEINKNLKIIAKVMAIEAVKKYPELKDEILKDN